MKIILDPGGCRISGGKPFPDPGSWCRAFYDLISRTRTETESARRTSCCATTPLPVCLCDAAVICWLMCVFCRDSREEALGEYYMRKYAKSSGGEQWVFLWLHFCLSRFLLFFLNWSILLQWCCKLHIFISADIVKMLIIEALYLNPLNSRTWWCFFCLV